MKDNAENIETVAEEVKATATQLVERKQGVTAKTLGALREQVSRIKEAGLLNATEMEKLENLVAKIRTVWIEKNL